MKVVTTLLFFAFFACILFYSCVYSFNIAYSYRVNIDAVDDRNMNTNKDKPIETHVETITQLN